MVSGIRVGLRNMTVNHGFRAFESPSTHLNKLTMKLKIGLGITIIIYIFLLMGINTYKLLFGYLCAIDFSIMFLLFVFIIVKNEK
jgi:hypothetical protein